MALVWAVSTHVEAFRVHDAELLRRMALGGGELTNEVARTMLQPARTPCCSRSGRSRSCCSRSRAAAAAMALAVAVVMTLAPLSAELLKPLLAEPHVGFGRTIGAARGRAATRRRRRRSRSARVLVTPPRWRALAAPLAVAFMLGVGTALLIRAWHMPSDVLGGYLLGALWISLAVAGLRASDRRWPARRADAPR